MASIVSQQVGRQPDDREVDSMVHDPVTGEVMFSAAAGVCMVVLNVYFTGHVVCMLACICKAGRSARECVRESACARGLRHGFARSQSAM